MPEETLEERIDALHAEIEELITARIKDEAAQAVGVPEIVVRQLFNSRWGTCRCTVAKEAFK
jgi:hypothetical protein